MQWINDKIRADAFEYRKELTLYNLAQGIYYFPNYFDEPSVMVNSKDHVIVVTAKIGSL